MADEPGSPGTGVPGSVMPAAKLPTLRGAYGRSTAVWAHLEHRVEETWWLALSGTSSPDYNHALLHGPDAEEALVDVLKRISEAGSPAIVSLAGEGLTAGQALLEEGWVCVGALPFMFGEPRPGAVDPQVRRLREEDLEEARRVLCATFHVPQDGAAALYHPGLTAREDVLSWGLYDPDLISCGIDVQVDDDLYVGWALATDPAYQGRRYGARLIGHVDHWYNHHGPRSSLHLASIAGAALYAARRHLILEHWQHWSKPRWLLGG